MVDQEIAQVRRFNRTVSQRIGALEGSYLALGRPLGEARLIFELGLADGSDLRDLRGRLGLDSGYLSRLVRSLEAQGLVEVRPAPEDKRVRRIGLTDAGRAAWRQYDERSDQLASSLLEPLTVSQRSRLLAAMAEIERLVRAANIEIGVEPADSADSRECLEAYYAEIDRRFEGGFALDGGNPFDPGDAIPPSGWFVLARLQGEAVGCGALKRLDVRTGEIKRVWVSPKVRGLGLAERIMGRLECVARNAGFTTLKLDTNRVLTEAHALYRKLGYRETERYNDNPYAHFWFEKAV
ncbi:MarR family transcriptional regulator [Pseudaminobacter sp. 19-2017]|uniref:MarR family transcriptional regulator n=1 Tax=Pseudaminobacter soli (ex Zhang et al. 2022) TaxID=2831468 RepID=A0A942E3N8_9HYPH|nr:helix-turn-helix domain-containing GNAT family N-acetyltransferase [Pseudaminobacter soli]MBS3650381.1 MarR family transcriptional regulator [Pseudaminobacter soli]